MFTLEFIPNMDCNLDCYFCFASKKDSKERIVPSDFKQVLELIKRINDTNELFVKIYGGESLIYIDNVKKYLKILDEFIEENKHIDITCAIVTNGTIMPDHFLEFLKKELSYHVYITFSFEIDEYYQNKIRCFKNKAESYDIFIKNVEKYKSFFNLKRAHLQTVLTPELLLNVDKYISFMERNKDKYIFDLNPMFDDTFSSYLKSILDNMKILFNYYISKFKMNDSKHIGIYQPIRSLTSYFITNKEYLKYHCTAGHGQITLISNGDLYPCSKNYHLGKFDLCYGNIKEDINVLVDRFNSQKPLYVSLTSQDDKCTSCTSVNKIGCIGDCMAERLSYNNEHYQWVCKYNIKFGTESLRMVVELKGNEEFMKELSRSQNSKRYGFNERFLSAVKEYQETH